MHGSLGIIILQTIHSTFQKPFMRHLLITFIVLGGLWTNTVFAQETGELMMGVELSYSLGGTVVGAGIGGVVWLTDPGGPTSLGTTIKDGAVLGTLLGAIAGYFLLYNAAVVPGATPQGDNFDDLLGQNSAKSATTKNLFVETPLSKKKVEKKTKGFSLTLVNLNF